MLWVKEVSRLKLGQGSGTTFIRPKRFIFHRLHILFRFCKEISLFGFSKYVIFVKGATAAVFVLNFVVFWMPA